MTPQSHTEPHDVDYVLSRKDAILGSNRLRDAILGRKPPQLAIVPPAPKPVEPIVKRPASSRKRETFIPDALRLAMRTVEEETGIRTAALRGPARHRYLVIARRRVAMLAREKGCSFPQIGRALNRDHTTIMNLVGARTK